MSNQAEFDQFKNKITNPSTFGPGIWYTIHIMSRDATTEEKKKKFKEYIETTIQNLPCSVCQQHASVYYQSHPLSDFWNVKENGNDVGLFKWTWNFHNTVNNRLKKPYMSWEVAKMLYSNDSGVCNEVCGADVTPVSNNNTLPLNITLKEEPLEKYIPKNIIRPNSIEKSKSVSNRFRNA